MTHKEPKTNEKGQALALFRWGSIVDVWIVDAWGLVGGPYKAKVVGALGDTVDLLDIYHGWKETGRFHTLYLDAFLDRRDALLSGCEKAKEGAKLLTERAEEYERELGSQA